MWCNNSTTCGLCCNRHCMCHITSVPCLYTNPMTQYWYNNVLMSSTSFLNYQNDPENIIYGFSHAANPVNPLVNPLFHVQHDQEAGEQMATNEIDSWVLQNLYNNQIDGSLNSQSYCYWAGNGQDIGHFDHMQTQGIQVNYNENYGQSSSEGLMFSQEMQNDYSTSASLFHLGTSLQPSDASIIPEASIGTMNLPQQWPLTKFGSSPNFHSGNLVEETVGSHSNLTRISSLGTQQQEVSREGLKRPFQFPPMSRQERILRYFKKKKSRKYEKKTIHSSRKTYARTRPRVRGRFARSSQTDA